MNIIKFIQNLIQEFILCVYLISRRLSKDFLFYNTFWKVCKKNNLSPDTPWRPLKKKKMNFFQKLACSYLGYTQGDFEMWPPLSGGHLQGRVPTLPLLFYFLTLIYSDRAVSCRALFNMLSLLTWRWYTQLNFARTGHVNLHSLFQVSLWIFT